MGRITKDTGGGDFQQAPAGNHVARCIKLIDLGTQHGEYQGQPTVRNQVMIQWELCDEKMDDGKPFIVSAFVTNSLSEKAKLRGWLEAWRGRAFTDEELKGFDLQKVLGVGCMVNVIHSEKGKAHVSSVAKLPKSVQAPEAVNPATAFWLDEFDQAAFDALPKGIKAIIEQSDEYKKMKNGNGNAGHFDDMADDLPWRDDDKADGVPF